MEEMVIQVSCLHCKVEIWASAVTQYSFQGANSAAGSVQSHNSLLQLP